MALFLAGINGMKMGKYISDHDAKIAHKLAYIHVRWRPELPHRSL